MDTSTPPASRAPPADASAASFGRLVEREAAWVRRELKIHHLAFDDLLGFGHVGLLEARSRFDPSRSVNFEHFAQYRVRGAILDGVRRSGELSPTLYHRLRRMLVTWAAVGEPAEEPPTGPTRAHDAHVSYEAITQLAASFLLSSSIIPEAPPDPESALLAREDQERLESAIARLPASDQTLIDALYRSSGPLAVDGNHAAVARRDGVTRQSVWRRHRRMLRRLRAKLGEIA